MNERVFLRTKDVASMLGVTTNVLERLRREKRGPKWYCLGSSVRYDKADVERFIEQSVRE